MYKQFLIFLTLFLVVAFFMSTRQTMQLKKMIKHLEIFGDIYYGQDAKFPRARIIILTAIDEHGEVINAKRMRLMKHLIPSKMFDFPELIGENLEKLDPEKVSKEKTVQKALSDLIKTYMKSSSNY